jgi:aminoglycoside phosphotransferase (APT) family kinase protein
LDLALGVLRRAFPVLHFARRRLTVTVPGGSEGGGWIFELIEDLQRRGVAEISAEGLGRIDWTRSGMAIAQIAAASGQKLALKVALEKWAAREMAKEDRSLDALQRRRGLSGRILAALPRIEASGCFHETHYRLESWLPGRPASELMYRARDRAEAVEKAVRWITELHTGTLGPARKAAEDAEWARGVVLGVSSRAGRSDGQFADQVAAYLKRQLDQHVVPAVQGHGDFWLGNVIREPNSGAITGIIDWNHADEQAPPLEDVLHLLFHRKGFFSVYDPGAHLAALLQRRYDGRSRKLIIRYLRDLDLDPGVVAPLAVLYWVRYLATREPTLASWRGWYSRSYLRVRKLLGPRLGPDLDRLGSWLSSA